MHHTVVLNTSTQCTRACRGDTHANALQSQIKSEALHDQKCRTSSTRRYTPLPVTVLSPSQQSKAGLLTSLSSLNKRRKQVRRERVISLQKSVSQSFRERDRFQQSWKAFNVQSREQLRANHRFTHKRLQGPRVASSQTRSNASKGIWRVFTNTFMRDGEKLRYQNILRKALLLLSRGN